MSARQRGTRAGGFFAAAGVVAGRTVAGAIECLEKRRLLSSYTFVSLASFNNTDGEFPYSTLVDVAGTLYGTTGAGGPTNDGTIFSIPVGGHTISAVSTFNGDDGENSFSNLVVGANGYLYGDADDGGDNDGGTIFYVTAGDPHPIKLVSFGGDSSSAINPEQGLIADASGNLYGTSSDGGMGSNGTVFEVTGSSGGIPTIHTLATFNVSNGQFPRSTLVMDTSGNLFGTASEGGAHSDGTIFEVIAGSGVVTTLANFNGSDGMTPQAGPIMDSHGDLFGTTTYGGANGAGEIYELAAGSHTITTLASFNESNGEGTESTVFEDSSGDLFCTGRFGGPSGITAGGTVVELPAGSHTLTVLASFNGANGFGPGSGLIEDSNGNLYGTTQQGGAHNDGTVYELEKNTGPVALHISTVESDSSLATGKSSVTTGTSPLTTTATVTNRQDLWLTLSDSNTGSSTASLTGSSSNSFAKLGFVQPNGTATYAATFHAVSDEVSVGLALTAPSAVANIMDLVLPQGAWKSNTLFFDELDKIYKTTSLGAAVRYLAQGAAGRTKAASAANAIAESAAALFSSNDAGLDLLEHDLADIGIYLTVAGKDTLDNATEMDRLAKSLISTAALDPDIKTGSAETVDFEAGAG